MASPQQPTAPACNILSYALSNHQPKQQWTSKIDPSRSLTATAARLLIQRLGSGFDRMRLPKTATVMLIAPTTNLYSPIIFLATVGSGRIFVHSNTSSPTSTLVSQLKTAQPSLVLVDPTAWDKVVLEAVQQAGINRDAVFSFDEEDFSDPGKDILDWKVLLGRAVDGRLWRWPEMMDEGVARETVAVVDFEGGGEGVRLSHWDVLVDALRIRTSGVDSWLAVLPWYRREMAQRDGGSSTQKQRRIKL